MDIKDCKKVASAGEAETLAIDWQNWAGDQSLSMGELSEWQALFEELAKKFNLEEVFKENGII